MEAYKNLIKSLALFLFIAAVPSLCWAAGLFDAFSWPSLFLLLSIIFCLLWLKNRTSSSIFRKLLLSRGEAWALIEGNQILDQSPSFPGNDFASFKGFFHTESQGDIEDALWKLINENVPFQIKVMAHAKAAVYELEGIFVEGKFFLWLRNITDRIHRERITKELVEKKDKTIACLNSFLDLLPIQIWHRDEHQKLTYCNQAYAKAVEAEPSKIIEEGIELSQPRFAKTLARKAINTKESQFLEGATIADGQRRHFRIFEIPDLKDNGTLGFAYDITELKDTRMEIKHLLSGHDQVLDHLSTAIAVFDSNASLQYYNQAYIDLYSFDEDFLKLHPRFDEVLEDLRKRRQLPEIVDFLGYKKKSLESIKTQIEPEEELVHLPDERTIRIYSAPHPLGGVLFMIEDVTSTLALERNNKAILEAYKATLESLFEGVAVIGSDNKLKFYNPSFVRLWNCQKDEIALGHHLTDIIECMKVYFDYEGEWEAFKSQLIDHVNDRILTTGRLVRKDGTVVNFAYVPLPNGDHLLSYSDATDTLLVQQALQEKQDALETSDRFKSEFISTISQELRCPLNTIIGFAEILSHEYFGNLNDKQTNYIEGVLDSSKRLLSLVDDITDLADIETGKLSFKPHQVAVPLLIAEVLDQLKGTIESSQINIEIKVKRECEKWMLDSRIIKQILVSLLQNSLRYTPPEGTVTLDAIKINGMLVLTVRDTGIGISPETQEKVRKSLNEDMQEPDRPTGIGLSLVKHLVDLHKGHIEFTSELHQGTTFSCYFPQAYEEEEPKEGTPLVVEYSK